MLGEDVSRPSASRSTGAYHSQSGYDPTNGVEIRMMRSWIIALAQRDERWLC